MMILSHSHREDHSNKHKVWRMSNSFYIGFSCPLFYTDCLRLCLLDVSFETSFWRREFICCNFCSRSSP